MTHPHAPAAAALTALALAPAALLLPACSNHDMTDIVITNNFPQDGLVGVQTMGSIVIENTGTNNRTLKDIDFAQTLSESFDINAVTPKYTSSNIGYATDTYTFDINLPPNSTTTITFAITPLQPGGHAGAITVSIDSGFNVKALPHTLSVGRDVNF